MNPGAICESPYRYNTLLLRLFPGDLYGIMTEEFVFREIRINEAAGQGDSDSRMTSFEVIMPLELQLTMKALL